MPVDPAQILERDGVLAVATAFKEDVAQICTGVFNQVFVDGKAQKGELEKSARTVMKKCNTHLTTLNTKLQMIMKRKFKPKEVLRHINADKRDLKNCISLLNNVIISNDFDHVQMNDILIRLAEHKIEAGRLFHSRILKAHLLDDVRLGKVSGLRTATGMGGAHAYGDTPKEHKEAMLKINEDTLELAIQRTAAAITGEKKKDRKTQRM